jgi:hypothetical protein
MESPYTPGAGVSPPLLVGRDQVLGRAVELFARTANFGSPGQSPLIMTGVRGVGKTVLLQAITDDAAAHGYLIARITVDRHGSLPARIAAAAAAAVEPLHPTEGGRWKRWSSRLRQLTVEVTVPGVKVVHPAQKAKAGPSAKSTNHRDAVVALLRESAQQVRPERPGLCLSFDELQEGSEQDLGIVTALAQELVDQPLVIVGAGLPNTPDRLMQAGSFAERFQYHRLGPLAESDAIAVLLVPAGQRRVLWNEDAASVVLTAAAGSPYLLQLFGNATWRAANPQPGSRITVEHAQAGITTATSELRDGLFRGRWNRASPVEQQYLAAMAARLDRDGATSSSEVAAGMGRTTAQLSTIRARLLDKGLIYSPARGRIAFTMPGFGSFVEEVHRGAEESGGAGEVTTSST